ncbi:MAG TPA: hypothetical protein VK524_09975 [Polyangiaceae bacterium]|nr:hypothetical protein [Polyangiaceae bacterium]
MTLSGKRGKDAHGGHHPRHDAGVPLADAAANDAGSTDAAEQDSAPDADATSSPPDAGDPFCTPSAALMGPCIWDLISNCLPPLDSCIRQVSEGDTGDYTRICDTQSTWLVENSSSLALRENNTTVTKDGKPCYSTRSTWVTFGPFITRYYDAAGSLVATEELGNDPFLGRRVICHADEDPQIRLLPTCVRPPSHKCASISDGVCP